MAAPCEPQALCSTETPQFMRSVDGAFDAGTVMTRAWGCMAFKRIVASGATTQFDMATITGNPFELPFTANDTHYCSAAAVDATDRLWVCGNHHNQPLHLLSVPTTPWPPAVNAWTTYPFAGSLWEATGLNSFSYSQFLRRVNGDLILFIAQEDPGSQGGRDIIAARLPAGSSTWVPLFGDGTFASTPSTPPTTDPDRIYTIGVTTQLLPDGTDRVWGMWQWARIQAPGELTHEWERQQPFCLYSDNLTTWRTVTGQTVTMPKQWTDPDRLTNNCTVTGIPLYTKNVGGFCLDSSGYPHVILQNGTNFDTATMPYWLHIWWDGTAWQNIGVAAANQGSSIGPMLVALRGDLWTVCSGGDKRLRCKNLTTGATANLGTEVPAGCRPWYEPVGARDRGRITMMVPDGDTPNLYDLGVPISPHP